MGKKKVLLRDTGLSRENEGSLGDRGSQSKESKIPNVKGLRGGGGPHLKICLILGKVLERGGRGNRSSYTSFLLRTAEGVRQSIKEGG